MCKVEFSFHGQVKLSTDSVTCLSTECRDQDLKDFVPCGPEIELDISGLYKTDLIDKAYLKFIVKADDGAGNVNIREKSVLIDKNRWEYVPLTGPGSSLESESVQTLFPITDDRIHMLTKTNKIFEYLPTDQSWRELIDVAQLGPRDFLGLENFVVMPDQTIYGLWKYSFNENILILRRPPGKPWEHLTGANSPPGCSWLTRDFAGNLFCKYKGFAYSYSGETWKEIMLSDSEGADLCYKEMSFAIVKQTQWVYCSGRVFSRPSTDSQWVERQEFGSGFPGNIVEDQYGNIWVASDPWSDEFFVGHFNGLGQWVDALAGKSLKYQTSTVGILSLSASGNAQYGSFVWDTSLQDWKPRYSFRNPLAFLPVELRHGLKYDSFQLWDSSVVISIGNSDYLFTFPDDRWNPQSLEVIDYHSQSQQFFSVIGYPGSSTDRHLIALRKRKVMDWLPVVADNQLYDEYQLARLTDGETFFFAGQKLIYRQDPDSGAFEVFRRFSDREDIFVGTTGQIVFAYQSGKALFDLGGGNFTEFTLPQDIELTKDQFLKDRQLWAVDQKSPILYQISPDGSSRNLNIPAACYGGPTTVLTHTDNQIYLLGGANMCMASVEDLIFKPFTIPGYSFETGSTLVARLSMSRLALRASAEDSTVSIIDLEKRALEGPFTLPTENLLNLQESPRSRQLFALYSDRVERLINGKWETVMTSQEISARLGKTDMNLKTLAVDREDSFLVGMDGAPLVRIFLK